jgi:DNA-binding PadR family transcriptional regulator
MSGDARPSPLALAVLGLLYGGPLHPYRMQRLIKEWGKDEVINVGQRSSLYKTIKRLHELGLIAVRETTRDHAYPERTVYELTASGRRSLLQWLAEMLSTPRKEFPQFPAALSFAMLLSPEDALAALERRNESLRDAVQRLDDELTGRAAALPRIALLESEYQRAVTAAELAWVERIVDELRTGALSWSETDFEGLGSAYQLDDDPGRDGRS